jgi:hypothetical protein
MVFNRNPVNFFAETGQVAFHPGHVVPGIDFTNDPLLQGAYSRTRTPRSAASVVRTFMSCRSTVRVARCGICNATVCVGWT